jgi:OOP family OmpA-OmpF porin
MKINLTPVFVLLFTGVVLAGCATLTPVADFETQKIDTTGYEQKVANVLIVYDASSSMDEGYNGHKKHDIAMAVVKHLNQTIPEDLDLKSGVRTFGHDPKVSSELTTIFLPVADHTQARLEAARLKFDDAGGTSPMAHALNAAAADITPLEGKTALIVISDADSMGKAPLEAAAALKKEFGDKVCVYTILVGDDPEGTKLMQAMAAIDQCGAFKTADSLLNGPAMAAFTQQVLLGERLDSDGDGVTDDLDQCPGTPANVTVDNRGCPLDTDGDGVPDYKDQCPGTPAGVKVDMNGCALDTDGDGVPDYKDKCPDTPKGIVVDQTGCAPIVQSAIVTSTGTLIFEDVQFDSGKWSLKSTSYPILDQIADTLKQAPDLKVEIQGHTDSQGSRAYNLDLSEKRAEAVRAYLIKAGVPSTRLTAKGFGPDQPLTTNATREGRAQNRRVEFKPLR